MAFDMSSLIVKPKRKRKLAKVPGRAAMVTAICAVIREDWRNGTTTTLISHEGAIWAALRSWLCLGGMGWHEAHKTARDMLQEAFANTGAKRPAWKEGQPEWCDGGVIRDTRTTCANCEKWLEPEQKTYCSKLCFDAHRARLYRADNLEHVRALERIREARYAQS